MGIGDWGLGKVLARRQGCKRRAGGVVCQLETRHLSYTVVQSGGRQPEGKDRVRAGGSPLQRVASDLTRSWADADLRFAFTQDDSYEGCEASHLTTCMKPKEEGKRLNVITPPLIMPAASSKRATVYFDSALHKALRLKAAETERSVSDVVNEAVRALLAEDAEDLSALRERAGEPTVSYETFVQELKAEGSI